MSVCGNGHWKTMYYIINYNDLMLHETRILVHIITITYGGMIWLLVRVHNVIIPFITEWS